MASTSRTADTCSNCKSTGAQKGTDDYGHICCRLCRESWAGGGRSVQSQGETWLVQCMMCETRGSVTAVSLIVRSPQPRHAISHDVFRSSCRMIEVVVGKDEAAVNYMVHEPILTASSTYFQGALKPTFQEGADGKIVLEQEDPRIFGLINEYLYTGHIRQVHSSEVIDGKEVKVMTPTSEDYAEIWLLADYLDMQTIKNKAMLHLAYAVDDGTHLYSPATMKLLEDLYDKAPMESLMRKYIVDLCIWSRQDHVDFTDDPPLQLMKSVVRELKKKSAKMMDSPLNDVNNYYEKDPPRKDDTKKSETPKAAGTPTPQ